MATMPAWEVPVLPTPRPGVEPAYRPRHRGPLSPLAVELGDAMQAMSERAGLLTPHKPRHRADVAVTP